MDPLLAGETDLELEFERIAHTISRERELCEAKRLCVRRASTAMAPSEAVG